MQEKPSVFNRGFFNKLKNRAKFALFFGFFVTLFIIF